MQQDSSVRTRMLVFTISDAFNASFMIDLINKLHPKCAHVFSFQEPDNIALRFLVWRIRMWIKMRSIKYGYGLVYRGSVRSLRHLGNARFPWLVLLHIAFVLKMNGKNSREIIFRAKSWTSKISENSQENVLFNRHV